MRLSISNIAWDVTEDEDVASLLRASNVDAIDVAPGKYFPDPTAATPEDIGNVKKRWNDRGLALTGMQALLFGTTGLNMFGDASTVEAMLKHLAAVCRVGKGLGATRLVFGSPRNRDRSGLDDQETLARGVLFFSKLGAIAASEGVMICLEPNPSAYGANFMTTSDETATVVKATDHPAIRMQLDTGALAMNHENPSDVLAKYASLIGHIHVSEPNLLPLGDGGVDHARVSESLANSPFLNLACIEMLATKNEPHLGSITRSVQMAQHFYRPDTTQCNVRNTA